jgi:hypothetical protein
MRDASTVKDMRRRTAHQRGARQRWDTNTVPRQEYPVALSWQVNIPKESELSTWHFHLICIHNLVFLLPR